MPKRALEGKVEVKLITTVGGCRTISDDNMLSSLPSDPCRINKPHQTKAALRRKFDL